MLPSRVVLTSLLAEIPFPAWNPVLLDLGWVQVRWYSLMYIVGFLVGYWILQRLRRARFLPLSEEKVGDLIFWLILGVMLGGRIGYVVFYQLMVGNWDYISNPINIIAIWEGGLSFHGGLLGVLAVTFWFTKRNNVSTLRVADGIALAGTPGIFAVRIANFINGELYGREADASVPWAMRFPTDPEATSRLRVPPGLSLRDRERALMEKLRGDEWESIREKVPLRHPSQIYEALTEGLLLGLALWVVYRLTRDRPLGSGVYLGVLLLGYGLGRFAVEYWRKPDDHIGFVFAGLSMGQLLCLGMIIAGSLLILVRGKVRGSLVELDESTGVEAKTDA